MMTKHTFSGEMASAGISSSEGISICLGRVAMALAPILRPAKIPIASRALRSFDLRQWVLPPLTMFNHRREEARSADALIQDMISGQTWA